MIEKLIIVFVLAAVWAPLASAAPFEASGVVIAVESGDVFDVEITVTDPRIVSGIETVRLAGVISPPMGSALGKAAKEFASKYLMNRTVWLDIDEERDGGRDPEGRLISVVYLEDPDGEINLTHPFNRILVDGSYAEVGSFEGTEFDPAAWWRYEGTSSSRGEAVCINEVEANPDGSDDGNEWLELYNPGTEDVDIGGWTATSAGGSVVSIPSGTTVPTGGFFVVTFDGYWLRNREETVVLRDEEGAEVDRTPALDDDGDDDYSWSRYPDGGDEWVYIVASPGTAVPSRDLAEEAIYEDTNNWLSSSCDCCPYGLWDISDFLQ
ncbi:lamin tail domain-containing protein [Candidatus Methanocrinis natronophilus]|uniref:Lamin tail domain-containing protein n=1 Tax=Candidatus Methanocrinis natronophilus TaxID=3033396 RepID=A0ABT5XAK3_9EURY|nr:lamin tail domain-containing protein [Candidatus Methanocrinis natronophilus]MDF0591713.1 lamin tail domain-containing protein [Candidatus Methanocrinis natronophilus]